MSAFHSFRTLERKNMLSYSHPFVPPKPRLIRIVMLSLSHMAPASVRALRV